VYWQSVSISDYQKVNDMLFKPVFNRKEGVFDMVPEFLCGVCNDETCWMKDFFAVSLFLRGTGGVMPTNFVGPYAQAGG